MRGSCRRSPPPGTTSVSNKCEQPTESDEHTAEPDESDERLPPQAQLPAPLRVCLTQHCVELTVQQRLDRRLIGLRRRAGEEARLRPQDVHPTAARRTKLRFDRSPVGTCDRSDG